jgi:hypothetical protein
MKTTVQRLILFLSFSLYPSALFSQATVYGYLSTSTSTAPAGTQVQFTLTRAMNVYPIFEYRQTFTVPVTSNGYFAATNVLTGYYNVTVGPSIDTVSIAVPNNTNSYNFLDLQNPASVLAAVPSSYYLATNGSAEFVTDIQLANIDPDSLAAGNIVSNSNGELVLVPSPVGSGGGGSENASLLSSGQVPSGRLSLVTNTNLVGVVITNSANTNSFIFTTNGTLIMGWNFALAEFVATNYMLAVTQTNTSQLLFDFEYPDGLFFHANHDGFGAVGNGTSIPYIAVENDVSQDQGIYIGSGTVAQNEVSIESESRTGNVPSLRLIAAGDLKLQSGIGYVWTQQGSGLGVGISNFSVFCEVSNFSSTLGEGLRLDNGAVSTLGYGTLETYGPSYSPTPQWQNAVVLESAPSGGLIFDGYSGPIVWQINRGNNMWLDWNTGNLTVSNTVITGKGVTVGTLLTCNYGNGNSGSAYNFLLGGAGNALMTGSFNLAQGNTALAANTSGADNIALGADALLRNQGGSFNAAVGVSALSYGVSANNNTGVGWEALFNNATGNNNTAIGFSALTGAASMSGSYNTAAGSSTMEALTSGSSNTAAGWSALQQLTSGNANTAAGVYALFDSVTGSNNTAVGYGTLLGSLGAWNTALGYSADGINNLALGAFAGSAWTSSENNNIAIGNQGRGGRRGHHPHWLQPDGGLHFGDS